MVTTSIVRSVLVGVAMAATLQALSAGTAMAEPFDDTENARYEVIQREHFSEIMAIPGVHGMGVGPSRTDQSRLVIFVYVEPGRRAETAPLIPTILEGAPVEVVEKAPATLQ